MRIRDPHFRSQCLIYSGLALVTLCLYLPVLQHDFVNYDDQQYVTDNPRVQAGLTWHGLVWAFGFYAGNWHPLTWLSHMLDCQLYGAWAGGHHLTSLLLHTVNTLLLFAVLHRMTRARWRSAAVAALFAWHPLHVESVAWVAERKDVLCACFWMLTLLAYSQYVIVDRRYVTGQEPAATSLPPRITRHASPWYGLSLVLFALALMAKPMAVTLPFVLLLLDFWPLQRMRSERGRLRTVKAMVLEKLPFLLLSVAGCVLTLHAQQIAIVSTAGLTMPQRVAHALAAYNHYFGAMFWPLNLAVYYPYQVHLPVLKILGAAVVLGVTTMVAMANIRQRPYLLVGWLWYLGTLIPVIGLVQVGDQAWADRYTYLPLVGLFVMVVWLASELIRHRLALPLAFALGAAGLMAQTALQVGYWKNTRTLFAHAEQATPANYLAITMLGSLLASEHKYDAAIEDYQRALSYQPDFPEAHFFLGAALDEEGKLAEALAEYRQALWFKPTQEQTHIFMGIALAKQKKYDEAIAQYLAALKLNPDSAVTHNNLARIFHTQGKFDDAIAHYRAALELDPKLSLAHNNLGILLLQKNDLPGGTAQLREALRLNSTNTETQFNLALALNQQQQWSEAAGLFAKTVGPGSPDPKAHYAFATALAHAQQTLQAMSEYASALLLQPDFPDALDGLAWILSTDSHPDFRNGTEAIKMAERACELSNRQDPLKLKTLAAAYAETGRFAEAITTLQTAKDLATKASRTVLVTECERMLEQFQRSESWRGL